jgi:hypothetical protein
LGEDQYCNDKENEMNFPVSFWEEITSIVVPRTRNTSKLLSEEYLSPANEATLAELSLDMQSNEKLKKRLEEQLRRLPEYKFLVGPGQKTTPLEMMTDIIQNEFNGDEYRLGFFVMSDKTDRMVGFAAYSEDGKDRSIVTDIIIFRFDDKEKLNMDDMFMLIRNLLRTHSEVWWSTNRLNYPGIQKYKMFVIRFRKLGYDTDVDPIMPKEHRLFSRQADLMYFRVYNKQ